MRLWSLHPKYLDARGLTALWRESLLARAVLAGHTQGYRHHPQLERFRAHEAPLAAIDAYLIGVYREARARGYAFDATKLNKVSGVAPLPVPAGQLAFEWTLLLRKLAERSPALYETRRGVDNPDLHPLFCLVRGPVAPWEKVVRHVRSRAFRSAAHRDPA